jgi:hypothetical protein
MGVNILDGASLIDIVTFKLGGAPDKCSLLAALRSVLAATRAAPRSALKQRISSIGPEERGHSRTNAEIDPAPTSKLSRNSQFDFWARREQT